jgi:hypothetical protein
MGWLNLTAEHLILRPECLQACTQENLTVFDNSVPLEQWYKPGVREDILGGK